MCRGSLCFKQIDGKRKDLVFGARIKPSLAYQHGLWYNTVSITFTITGETDMKIAFMGDSVTEGCFGLYPVGASFDTFREPEKVYHAKLLPMLEAKYGAGNVEIINAGLSGDNTTGGCKRLDRDVLSHHPDCVVICYGLNDSNRLLERFERNLREILGRVLASGARAVFLTPNMLNTYVDPRTLPEAAHIARRTMEIQNGGTMDRFMDAARVICAELGVDVCDAYAYWKKLAQEGVDTTAHLANYINHPDEEMHGVFARMLAPML